MAQRVVDVVDALLGSRELPRDAVRRLWQQLGFEQPQSADGLLTAVAEDPFAREPLRGLLPALIEEARPLGDLDRMFRNLIRFVQAHGSPRYVFALLAETPPLRDLALRLWTFSESLSDVLVRNPEYLEWLISDAELERRRTLQQLRADLTRALAPFREDLERALEAVRRFHRRELLRIGVRDIAGLDGLDGIVHEISHLADVVIEAVLQLHRARLQRRYGVPRAGEGSDGAPVGFCVLGMGKLGAEELNYSSDIDLIFVYGGEGHVWLDDESGPRRGMTNHEYFNHLGKHLVESLTAWGREGFLYRVDLRLRPEGSSGALVRSAESCKVYYASQGETWERMAMIKARPVAGDIAAGEALLAELGPFIYPRHPPRDFPAEIRRIKSRAEREVVREGELESNLKLGRGGIREIEFIVQALQLRHAGAQPQLRGRRTLDMLGRLAGAGLIEPALARELADAYCLLRTLEHRIQMDHHRQTHTLPADAQARRRLAASLGRESADVLVAELGATMGRVRAIYDSVLASVTSCAAGDSAAPSSADGLVDAVLDGRWGEAERLLAGFGWAAAELPAGVSALGRLARGPEFGHSSPRTRRLVRQVLSELVRESRQMARPSHVLDAVDRFVTAYGARSSLLEGLASKARALSMLWHLFDGSDILGEALIRQPRLFDELAARVLACGAGAAGAAGEQALDAASPEPGWAELARVAQEERLRVGARFLEGLDGEHELLRQLSDLADRTLAAGLRLAACEFPWRAGDALTVLAAGGWGGREVGFAGVLEAIFVGPDDEPARAVPFVAGLIRRLERTAADVGPLLRLAPMPSAASAEAAPAVIAPGAARSLLAGEAGSAGIPGWIRLRRAGGILFGAERGRGGGLRELAPARPQGGWRAERLLGAATCAGSTGAARGEGGPEQDPGRSLGRGPGGALDLELLGGCAALRRACRGGARVVSAAVPEMLAIAAEDGWLGDAGEEIAFLYAHYGTLRRVEQLLALRDGQSHELLPVDPVRLGYLALRLGHAGESAFVDWHRQQCRRCRALCQQALARVARRDFGLALPFGDR